MGQTRRCHPSNNYKYLSEDPFETLNSSGQQHKLKATTKENKDLAAISSLWVDMSCRLYSGLYSGLSSGGCGRCRTPPCDPVPSEVFLDQVAVMTSARRGPSLFPRELTEEPEGGRNTSMYGCNSEACRAPPGLYIQVA
ncbi:hypothetical protein EYF80_010136 [Liparis tanakae]|uniref:Uncharacterized protein n=1 Tax=Liparis tanakae TaxID=230148 RepID=A0A4Z2IPY4_9TELE|nr:hypothetical protein EYF80_010136 [Liparis tanakae]